MDSDVCLVFSFRIMDYDNEGTGQEEGVACILANYPAFIYQRFNVETHGYHHATCECLDIIYPDFNITIFIIIIFIIFYF